MALANNNSINNDAFSTKKKTFIQSGVFYACQLLNKECAVASSGEMEPNQISRQVWRPKLILSPCTTNHKRSSRREKDNIPIRLRESI